MGVAGAHGLRIEQGVQEVKEMKSATDCLRIYGVSASRHEFQVLVLFETLRPNKRGVRIVRFADHHAAAEFLYVPGGFGVVRVGCYEFDYGRSAVE